VPQGTWRCLPAKIEEQHGGAGNAYAAKAASCEDARAARPYISARLILRFTADRRNHFYLPRPPNFTPPKLALDSKTPLCYNKCSYGESQIAT